MFLHIVVFLSLVVSNVYADKIEIRADSWCPYNCEPSDKNKGFMIEIAEEALKTSGHSIDYKLMPWARAVKEANDGNISAVVGAAKEDAPDLIFPTESLGKSSSCFFVDSSSSWKFDNLASLNGQVLGAIKDYSYSEALDKYIVDNAKDPNKVAIISGETALKQNVEKMKLKRVSVVVEDSNVMADHLKTTGQSNQVKLAGCLPESREVYIAFSPKNPNSKKYAEELSKGIESLRKSGQLKTILDKYGAKDWK